jgi:hypothetical protein
MKVICINEDFESPDDGFTPKPTSYPKVPEIYTVIDIINCPCGCGSKGYTLLEIDNRFSWRTDHFAIITPEKATHSTAQETVKI